jgi:predicted nuclease of predicted toxin-antitoxin system
VYFLCIIGIPPHVTLLQQMNQVRVDMQRECNKVLGQITKELDERSVGGLSVSQVKQALKGDKHFLENII